MSSSPPPPIAVAAISNAPLLPQVSTGKILTFTNLVLVFIFVLLLTRLLFIYISIKRNPNHHDDPSTSTHDEENNNAKGLNIDVINSYKTFPYKKLKKAANNNSGNIKNYGTLCCICLSDYKDSEILRMIPVCEHYFHRDCLDVWLKFNGSCPICRNSPSLKVVVKN